ncbi:MAG: ribosomal protein L7/L12 [Planctomycetota bacterium]|jgi:hypothetical protein
MNIKVESDHCEKAITITTQYPSDNVADILGQAQRVLGCAENPPPDPSVLVRDPMSKKELPVPVGSVREMLAWTCAIRFPDKKIKAMKYIREIFPKLGLREAKELVESLVYRPFSGSALESVYSPY